jgi:HEPN domain-containing protein
MSATEFLVRRTWFREMSEEVFHWPAYPQSEEEFEALMRAIDAKLSSMGLKPSQRPLNVPHLLWEAFGWGGDVCPPKSLAQSEGYEGEVLMAKAHRWYQQNYGEKLKSDLAVGFVPYRLGNAIWRVRLAVIFGSVELFVHRDLRNVGNRLAVGGSTASFNALTAIEDLPQGLANRISAKEAREFLAFYVFAYGSLQWHSELANSELLRVARNDYASSTSDVLAGHYGQARWNAQQAVEKTLKGLLQRAGMNYPTGGRHGHDLIHLTSLLNENQGVRLESSHLIAASCSPKVRYGEVPSSEADALTANHAVLGVFDSFRCGSG